MFTRTKQGAVDVISGADPLNLDHVEDVRAVIEECLSSGQPRIVLDLREVPLLDSAGLEFLLEFRDRCSERGGQLQLAAVNPLCRDILEVTGLNSEFELFSDALAAAGSFAQ